MKTLILDMGGVIYSFSSDVDPIKQDDMFIQALQTVDSIYKDVSKEYKDLGVTLKVLEAEYHLVLNNVWKVYPIKEAIELLNTKFKDDNKIIVSTLLEQTSKLICERVGIIKIPKEIFNMSNFGSKKESNSWKKIFQTLKNIDVIVENSPKNLEAAEVASKELNFTPKFVKSIMEI